MKNLRKMIMIIVATAISMGYVANAQVAINKDGSAPNATSILHIKGDGTNKDILLEPGTGGNVGVGTDAPTATLDINGNLKVNDGSEGDNKIMVSDTEGNASWKKITDVSSGLMSPSFPNGLEGIIPKTIAVNSSDSYQVPNKVTFYILNVYSNNANSLQIDGLPLTFGEFNYRSGSGSVAQLNQPIMVGTGSVIDGSDTNDIIINGYLVGNGTGGGNPAWTCGDLLVDDRDGQDYTTVQIGNQCWMAENLNIGTMINGSGNQTDNSTIEKYCYNDNTTNCNTYGGLYQWDEMMQYVTTAGTQGICPTGWHLPTDAEWMTLEEYLGMCTGTGSGCSGSTGWRGTDEGGKLKETGTTHWASPNTGATNSSGFTALPGGDRDNTGGAFYSLMVNAFFWSSSENGTSAWNRILNYNLAQVARINISWKTTGFSVRCVRD